MEHQRNNNEGISVIIPVYNSEKTIENCIKSICRQTYRELQIICVNDGSKDKSLEILLKLQHEDERIQVITQKNGGAASARNTGIRHATQKYITFVDADDSIDPKMYEIMLSFLQEYQLECVCCEFLIRNYDGKTNTIEDPISDNIVKGRMSILEHVVKPLLKFNDYPCELLKSMVNKLFLKDIIADNNIFVDEHKIHGEDREFCLNYYQYIKSIGFVNKTFYHYIHWSKESLSTKVRMNYLESIFDSQNKFRNWYPELDWNSQKKKEEMLTFPVNTALYYRENLNTRQAKQKLDDIYDLCMDNIWWKQAASENETWKALMNDKKIRCASLEDDY